MELRRTLYDASNRQSYLNEQRKCNVVEEEEEDAMLSQALDQHQDKTRNMTSINIPATPSPPVAKKMKSLVQSLFDDGEEEENKKNEGKKTLAMFLNDSMEVDEDKNENVRKCAVFVDNTDSEDE